MWVSMGFRDPMDSVSVWLSKTFMIYGLFLYLRLKTTAIIYKTFFYKPWYGSYFLVLVVTKLFSWYRTLCDLLLKVKGDYSAIFFN